jgi:hypothetical protein
MRAGVAILVLCLLTELALTGCVNGGSQTTTQQRPNVITLQSGQKVCAVHYVPLITIKGYRPEGIGGEALPLEQYQRELEDKNPNFIPYFGFSRSRTKECTVPTEISYCPSCQAAYEGRSVY